MRLQWIQRLKSQRSKTKLNALRRCVCVPCAPLLNNLGPSFPASADTSFEENIAPEQSVCIRSKAGALTGPRLACYQAVCGDTVGPLSALHSDPCGGIQKVDAL